MKTPPLPDARPVTEIAVEGASVPIWTHPGWRDRHPWLAQGVTGRGGGGVPFDLALFADVPCGVALGRWADLLQAAGVAAGVHARQVHGAVVRHHRELPPGLHVAEPCDGHLTRAQGLLLGVTVADCVPVTLVDPDARTVAVLHAGWRGTAAGIVQAGIGAFRNRLGLGVGRLVAHLGPSICGDCYEVGPEVHEGLNVAVPAAPTPLDLHRVLTRDLRDAGVAPERITASTWCTRCGDSPFFSHRGGDPERQVAWAAVMG